MHLYTAFVVLLTKCVFIVKVHTTIYTITISLKVRAIPGRQIDMEDSIITIMVTLHYDALTSFGDSQVTSTIATYIEPF